MFGANMTLNTDYSAVDASFKNVYDLLIAVSNFTYLFMFLLKFPVIFRVCTCFQTNLFVYVCVLIISII